MSNLGKKYKKDVPRKRDYEYDSEEGLDQLPSRTENSPGRKARGVSVFARKQALELFTGNPNMSFADIGRAVGVSNPTVSNWFKDSDFLDKCYDMYMIRSGSKLPGVIDAMIREALEGNVQAGRLVLEHFGKLDNKIKIQIESPFEKFMKAQDVVVNTDKVENGQFIELDENDKNEFVQALGDYTPDLNSLPDRNKDSNSNDRTNKEKKKITHKVTRKQINNRGYELKKRAEAVGLKRLIGRPNKSKNEKWIKELERLEKLNSK